MTVSGQTEIISGCCIAIIVDEKSVGEQISKVNYHIHNVRDEADEVI